MSEIHVTPDLLVARTEGEAPFAKITRRADLRLWGVTYREYGHVFGDQFNCMFATKKQALAECQWAADKLTAHQLGLEPRP